MEKDVIYRQEAIDALEKLDIPEDMCVFEILSHVELAIGTLPSAEPEIVRCKDCKHRYTDECPMQYTEWVERDEYGEYELRDIVHDYTEDEKFCSEGERRANSDTD